MVTQTLFNALHICLVLVFFHCFGLVGISIALPILYAVYTGCMLAYCNSLTGFLWSAEVVRLVLVAAAAVGAAFLIDFFVSCPAATVAILIIASCASIFAIHGLTFRMPRHSRLRRIWDGLRICRRSSG